MNPDELPEVYEALLDDEGLAALARDIAACGTHVEIRTRGRRAMSSTTPARPLDVPALLEGTAAPAVQIRYIFERRLWCDSLRRTPEGVRLVRIGETPA